MRHESTSPNNDCPDKGSRNIINLTIPEGVQELPDDAFRGYNIFSKLRNGEPGAEEMLHPKVLEILIENGGTRK